MADHTNIEWADSTFNPWMGCTKISPACDHCYAERDTARFGRVQWGAGQQRVRTSEANWRKPITWNKHGKVCVDCVRPVVNDGISIDCACGQAGAIGHMRRRRVFCASLADVFDNEVDPQWRADLFTLIRDTPNLDWLLLTKRIGNVRQMLDNIAHPSDTDLSLLDMMPLPNVWIGATICNQAEADRDIPKLLDVPAAVRFVSIEPMLGPITLRQVHSSICEIDSLTGDHGVIRPLLGRSESRLHWVIAGGESGPHARPMHPDWVRTLRDQCAAAGTPFLFKQWGEWQQGSSPGHPDAAVLSDGRVLHDWTAAAMHHANRHQPVMPARPEIMARVGKKAAGRTLDGLEHIAFPEPHHD